VSCSDKNYQKAVVPIGTTAFSIKAQKSPALLPGILLIG